MNNLQCLSMFLLLDCKQWKRHWICRMWRLARQVRVQVSPGRCCWLNLESLWKWTSFVRGKQLQLKWYEHLKMYLYSCTHSSKLYTRAYMYVMSSTCHAKLHCKLCCDQINLSLWITLYKFAFYRLKTCWNFNFYESKVHSNFKQMQSL